jgi:hypothetical protein
MRFLALAAARSARGSHLIIAMETNNARPGISPGTEYSTASWAGNLAATKAEFDVG